MYRSIVCKKMDLPDCLAGNSLIYEIQTIRPVMNAVIYMTAFG